MTKTIDELETPCVLVDFDIAEANIDRFQSYCDEVDLKSRPHIKTHKIPKLAARQAAAGGVGITCQKISEAEVMVDAGIDDILITYNIVGKPKVAKLRALADRCTLSVVADNDVVIKGLSEGFADRAVPLPVLVECDTGAGRCGVQTPERAASLARMINGFPGIRFEGLMTYPASGTLEDQHVVNDWLRRAKDIIEAEGLACTRVSSGGSPNMWRAHESPVVTEHRAGTYVYNDRSLMEKGVCDASDCALTVLATIISCPTDSRAIIDAGSKVLTSDLLGLQGYGYVYEAPDAQISELSEEHGTLDLSASNWRPAVGDRVRIIPNHCCVVSNTADTVWELRGDEVIGAEPVAARGKVL